MKKIYLDVSMVMIGTNFTGVPRVVMELAKRLYNSKKFDINFVEYNQKNDAFRLLDTDGFIKFTETKTDKRNAIRTDKYIPFEEMEEGSIFFDCDTVWKTRVRRSFLYPILKKNGVKVVPFIHDIIGIDYPQFCENSDVMNFIDFIGASLLYADRIIVTTNTTKKAILAQGERMKIDLPDIAIVGLGGDFNRKTTNEENVKAKIKDIAAAGDYFLMVGTIEPRKNHKLLLETYQKHLRGKINLVMAGYSGQGMEDFFEKIANDPDCDKGLWHVDNASDDDINYLYKHAFAFVFPSYIEGYGLPLIEAFIREVPVIASDNDINREVAGERALFFEQDNSEDLAKIINELLSDEEKYKTLRESVKGYKPRTWDETGNNLIKEFEGIYGEKENCIC